jgi:hypothetical protein
MTINDTGPEATDASSPAEVNTRPAVASRHARRPKEPRKITRYTLDLEAETHRYLRLFAIQADVSASVVMRTLLYLLEADASLQQRVHSEMFADEAETA